MLRSILVRCVASEVVCARDMTEEEQELYRQLPASENTRSNQHLAPKAHGGAKPSVLRLSVLSLNNEQRCPRPLAARGGFI